MTGYRALQAVYLLLLAGALAVAARAPIAFQKANTLEPVTAVSVLAEGGPALDVAAVLGGIPYVTEYAIAVDPAARYRTTIEEGRGNCSQRVFGLAYDLQRSGADYQVVHMLPVDAFLTGGGHTVLRTRYELDGEQRAGLVDVHWGGVPTRGGRPLELDDLRGRAVEDLRLISLNPNGTDSRHYYGTFLETVVVGVIQGEEVNRYYRFLSSVYVPLGSNSLEKRVYDGLALLLGYLPRIYTEQYERLFEGRRDVLLRAKGALWVMRSALVVIPLMLGFEIARLRRLTRRA